MRFRILLLCLLVLAAACGSDAASSEGTDAPADVSSTAPAETPDTSTTIITAAPTEPPTSPPATTAAPQTEGPAAPDFTTVLADGTEFNLASHDRPVYLVFWAEW